MAFNTEIQALVGTATDSEMDQWLTDGAKEIINILPPELQMKCSSVTNLYIGNADTTMDMDGKGKILHVTRENADSGYYTPCREIPPAFGDLSNDSSNMMYYATATDPVYWIESNSSSHPTLFVKPTPTSNQPAKIVHIAYPSVDADSDSAIDNFPDEAEYLVVLYASIKVLQNKMNEKSSDLPSDVSSPTFPAAPAPPTMRDNTLDISTLTAPTYSPQAVAPDFEDANNWINTEEDNEMLGSRISVINAQISDFNAKMSNEMNDYNRDKSIWEKQIEQEIKNLDLKRDFDAQALDKYKTEINLYAQEVNQKVTAYTSDLTNYSAKIQKHANEYKWFQSQYTLLKQDYAQGILNLAGKGATPKQQQGGEK